MKINKNKKLYISIILFFAVIITCGILFVKKIEAPKIPEEYLLKNVKEELNDNTSKEEVTKTPAKLEKFKIINRSTIVSENIMSKNKIVLLTIDDGPSGRTLEMMDVLDKHNAKAIFFINGMHDKGYPGIIKKIFERGFSVGNHTWSHLNLKKEKDIKITEKEINENTELITKLTGSNPRFFRAPYGESNVDIRKKIKDDGMIFMDWSGAAKDWEKSTKEKDIFVGNVMKNIHSGSIILIHEHPWSLANLDALLTQMEKDGYTYVDPKDIVE